MYSFINFEYRYHASKNSNLFTITDFGTTDIQNSTKTLLGFGLGYHFIQKKNSIKLSTVLGKKPNQQLKLNNSKFILNFSTYF